jgi:glycosyltransferase involved in cell wall biosynthesis
VSARRLLIVTYYYPPQPGSGSNRWAAMVKYLRRLGHHVTVLTAAPPGHPAGESEGVIRTGNLNSSPLLRRVLLRSHDEEPVQGQGTQGVPGGVMAPWQWKFVVPDPWLVSWGGYAWRAVRRELRRSPVDCLITSSPAESTHTLGLAFRPRRCAWVADFRDGWGFEPLRPPFPTALQRRMDAHLEARVVRRADAVVGVTAPIAEDFGSRLGVPAQLITNGFDPELFDPELLEQSSETSHEGFTLVHTGALSGPRGRDPRPLLRALRLLIERRPELGAGLRVIVAGRSEHDERAMVEAEGVGEIVRHVGYLPRSEALALQRTAGALLLITSHDRCEATGKLYEYMASGRPVVALAEGNEAARIVAETNIGTLVSPDDVEAIAGALSAAIDGRLQRAYAPRAVERYAYPALAERMAEVIEMAIERRTLVRPM